MNAHTLWYITRATGIVALLLLSATTVLGILTTIRVSTERWPRFAWQDLHRRLSLLSVVFVGLHVASTVADGYAPIGWLSAFVPFTSPYRRLWLGLGTAAVDLLLAVGISSAFRARIRAGTWRALHYLAYLSWPLAVVHALGTGTDPRLHWVLALVVLCVASVVIAGVWRLSSGWPTRAPLRAGAGAIGLVSLIATSAWAGSGPLRAGWAAKAGTPPNLLGRTVSASVTPSSTGAGGSGSSTATIPAAPFSSSLTGTISERNLASGLVEVDITAAASGGAPGVLGIRLVGQPDGSGGVAMEQSSATFGPSSAPGQYTGRVVGLNGSRLDIALSDAASGTPLDLRVDMSIDGQRVSGSLSAVTSFGDEGSGGE
ncbi:MAG: ferric reductase-like transmembrane domain-containing protein [Acidimicrobiales bacterium]